MKANIELIAKERINEKDEVFLEQYMTPRTKEHREKIRFMQDDEKQKYFSGMSVKTLKHMAWRHGYGKNSMHYARYHDGKTKDETDIEESNK